jgi:hypothetical protein
VRCVVWGPLGTRLARSELVPRAAEVAPYAVANMFMAGFWTLRYETTQVRICPSCASGKLGSGVRTSYLVHHKPDYLRMLFREPPLQLQLLSFLDAQVNVLKHYHGFISGDLVSFSLLDNPIVSFGESVMDPQPLSEILRAILTTNLESNLLF